MTLRLSHLCKSFPTPTGDLEILRDVEFEMEDGDTVAIVGPSGTGKSTLLQIIGTLDRPTSGTVEIADQNPFEMHVEELAAFRNRTLGFVFQDQYLMPQLSVRENILIPALAEGNAAKYADRASELIAKIGLSDRDGHLPSQLSGGERGRVAVARAMLLKPKVLLADEPTGNLDPKTAGSIADLLLSMQQEEKTMLITVTHSMELAERMQRTMRLENGRLQ